MTKQCSCLVPAHNEATRILEVLRVLSQANQLKKIVVVDDGSTDETGPQVTTAFPNVKLVSLSKNVGKAAAVKAGLSHITTPYVLLCDADLQNLKVPEIDDAIRAITTNPQIDMIILRRVYEVETTINKFQRAMTNKAWSSRLAQSWLFNAMSCLLSGERILKTADLKRVLRQPVDGYLLEPAINQYFVENRIRVCWLPSSALSAGKIRQLGPLGFISKYLALHAAVISYLGIKKYSQQLRHFCTERCDSLSNL